MEPAPAKKAPAKVEKPNPQAARNPFDSSGERSRRDNSKSDNPFLAPAQRSQPTEKPATAPRRPAREQALSTASHSPEKPKAATPTVPVMDKPWGSDPQPDRQLPNYQTKPQPKPQPAERAQAQAQSSQQQRPTTPPPPEFSRRQQPAIGVSSLTLWTLLAMAVLLAAWSMIQLSGLNDRVASLSSEVQQLEQPAVNSDTANSDARLARLENNYQGLESRIQQLPQGNASNSDNVQSEKLAELEKQLSQLQNQQKELQTSIAALKTQVTKPAPTAASKPPAATPKPSGWVINIASLSNRDNALKLASKAKLLGADCRVESYPSQGRTLYRVRAFGYSSQSAAEQAAVRLQNGLGMSGLIVRKVD